MELPTALPTAAGTAWGNGSAWAPLPGQGANDTGPPRAKNATSILIAIVITALYSVVCVVGLLGNVLVMYGIVRKKQKEKAKTARAQSSMGGAREPVAGEELGDTPQPQQPPVPRPCVGVGVEEPQGWSHCGWGR
uniref:Uncharacterized protein n=1 Tax=Falco tinnunculus TaxID=100819 RepID=A0A8C4U1U7_FALTI